MKTARKGRNAGGQFFGCSNYPNCKGTRPLESDEDPIESVGGKPQNLPASQHPRRFVCASSSAQTAAEVIECAGVPRKAVAALSLSDAPASTRHGLAQWRLETPASTDLMPREMPPWFVVAEKLLQRGTLVPLSPALEQELQRLSGFDGAATSAEAWCDAVNAVARVDRTAAAPSGHFDSQEERRLSLELLPLFAGGHAASWCMTQVSIGSLTGDPSHAAFGQRVDMFIAHPDGTQLVVEVDGTQHAASVEEDKARDDALAAAGVGVLRVPAAEVRAGNGPELARLRDILRSIPSRPLTALTQIERFVHVCRRAHQVQIALHRAVRAVNGETIRVRVELDLPGWNEASRRRAAACIVEDYLALVADLCVLYGGEPPPRIEVCEEGSADVIVGVGSASDVGSYLIHDTFVPVPISCELTSGPPRACQLPDRGACQRLLNRVFGWSEFREGQFEAIERALRAEDAIVLLPTGSGKSIAFQLASLLRPGVCIVVDPILSLIDDQIENLALAGIDRTVQITTANDIQTRERLLELLGRGQYAFCYVAPERFQSVPFRDALQTLTMHTPVSLVAIDEAHCVSEWGHDFRPAYLRLADTARRYCTFQSIPPPVMALTGTASRSVLKDVQRELGIDQFEAIITPTTFDRPELRFEGVPCHSSEKEHRLKGLLEAIPRRFGRSVGSFFTPAGDTTMGGLVFCPHVNGDFGVLHVADVLQRHLGQPVPSYSGGGAKKGNDLAIQQQRRRTAARFKRNRVSLMACTKSFGMGIDKSNIRYTVHYNMPPSIEAFYQEAGRAGRDGKVAECKILFSDDDPERTKALLNPSAPIERVRQESDVGWKDADDVTRMLWFHGNSFQGPDHDFAQIQGVIEAVGDWSRPRTVTLPFDEKTKLPVERALCRLTVLGAVADYTVASRVFTVQVARADRRAISDALHRYLASYQRDLANATLAKLAHEAPEETGFLLAAARALVSFIYEVVERGRRQALAEMLAVCTECKTDEAIRERVLAYLGTSALSEAIEAILSAPAGGVEQALATCEGLQSSLEAAELRGQAARALEAYPDQPGLRLARGVAEALCGRPNGQTVEDNVEACVRFGSEKYGLDRDVVEDVVLRAANVVAVRRVALGHRIVRGLLSGSDQRRSAARKCVKRLPRRLRPPALAVLLTCVREDVRSLGEAPSDV